MPCPGSHSQRVAAQVRMQGCLTAGLVSWVAWLPGQSCPAHARARVHHVSPSPARETVEQMASVKPADIGASMTRDGHLQGLGEAEEAPPRPSRPPDSRGPKSATSHQSSLASLEGSGISERLPPKSLRQAGGPPLEVCIGVGPLLEPPASRPLLRVSTAPASAVAPRTPTPLPGPPLSPLRPVAQCLYLSEPA